MTRGSQVRALLLDVAPLRLDHDYRWLWLGQVVTGTGNQITRIALPFQVYVLTHSTLAIAALTAVQLVPILVFSLGAGSIADAVDRRRLLAVTQVGLALCSAAFVGLSLLPETPILGLFAVAFVAASISSFDQPARSSAVPRLVPPERLPAAIALGQLNFNAQAIIGPAIGGLLLATIGVAGAYAVDAIGFSASLVALWRIRPLPPMGAVARPSLAAVRDGLRFARSRPLILSTFAIDLDAMVFGMPQSLFPALALDVFRAGPAGLGFLEAAPAVGAFVGALMSGWVSRVRFLGRATIRAVLVWGLAITAFGVATFSFPLALLFLAIAGGADVLSAVFRSTIVQLATPDELRGRISSLHVLVVTSGPRVGDIEAAAAASIIGPQLSVISGGVLCILGVFVVARLFPELSRQVGRPSGAVAAA